MSACICSRNAVRMDCPVHGDESYRRDFLAMVGKPSVMDDPEWQRADREAWDRRKALEEGHA